MLVLPKLSLGGADLQLLSSEAFRHHSAAALRTLLHVSPGVQPLLHQFARLKQVHGGGEVMGAVPGTRAADAVAGQG